MDRNVLSARAATLLKNKTAHDEVEKYALEVYDNWSSKPIWLAAELTDYEDRQYCRELIQALRDESWNRRKRAKLERLQLEDKLLGTNRAEEFQKQQKCNSYCCLKDELRALDKEIAERPKSYVVDGNVYYRDEALELYEDFGDTLISLDWAGKQDLSKVPTEYLARWLAAMKAILASEQLIRLYTEEMPETKGGNARYGVCPDCGELFLLDEGRDNYCPNCDKLVLENQLVYNNTPEDYGYTSYKGDWVDLGADISYEGLFRATVDDEAPDYLDGVNNVLDSLGPDNEDVGL